jgi:hypothetical protein
MKLLEKNIRMTSNLQTSQGSLKYYTYEQTLTKNKRTDKLDY